MSGSRPAEAVRGGGRPGLRDVARLAGVSHQTVSRVLNEHPNVAPIDQGRVLAAIRELAYRPNAAARALVTRRTRIGVISADTMLYGPTSMLYAFEGARASRLLRVGGQPAPPTAGRC